jgi:hypothetical protein
VRLGCIPGAGVPEATACGGKAVFTPLRSSASVIPPSLAPMLRAETALRALKSAFDAAGEQTLVRRATTVGKEWRAGLYSHRLSLTDAQRPPVTPVFNCAVPPQG